MQGQKFQHNELKTLKPFDYQLSFPRVMQNGGFDAIVGNPPYVRIQTLRETAPDAANYYGKEYHSAKKGNYDLYVIFIERAMSLLAQNGLLGYIVPNKFFTTDYGEGIRKIIADKNLFLKIIDFGSGQVFKNATTYTCLLFLKKKKQDKFLFAKIDEPSKVNESAFNEVSSLGFNEDPWKFSLRDSSELLRKLEISSVKLGELPCQISRGSSTGNDKVFVIEKNGPVMTNGYGEIVDIEDEIFKIPIFATDFTRYYFKNDSNKRLVFPYYFNLDKSILYAEDELKEKYPKAYTYLFKHKKLLTERKQYQLWFGFSAPRSLALHVQAQIIVPLLADHGMFSLPPVHNSDYTLMAGGGFSLMSENSLYNKFYLLALINSKLLFWYLRQISNVFRGGWITCTKQYFSQLPIKKLSFKTKERIEKIGSTAEEVIEIKKKLIDSKTEKDKEYFKTLLAALEREIDTEIYQLYELSEVQVAEIEM